MGQSERQDLIRQIEAKRDTKLICYLTSDRPNASAEIKKDVKARFFEHLQRARPPRVDVLMFTQGGETIAAFGLARLVREFADWVGVLIPDMCHSAGTLFALGADQIVMTRAASLSPIDPSIRGPLNPTIEVNPGQRQLVPLSVESVAGFKTLVTEDWGIKADEPLAAILRALAERVHPLALGDVFRVRQQIEHLATQLLLEHRKDEDHAKHIVDTLTKRLGSHDYLISRREARKLLLNQVAEDDEELEELILALYEDFSADMELGVPYDANMLVQTSKARGDKFPVEVTQQLAIVESATHSDVAMKRLRLSVIRGQVAPGIMSDGVAQELVEAGWKRNEVTT